MIPDGSLHHPALAPAGGTSPLFRPRAPGIPVLQAGFRPFFLAAGVQAALMVPVWLVIWLGGIDLGLGYAPTLWHGHEMLFGFGSAAVAGFLLTAVPNWTGTPPVSGARLLALTLLWLAARVAFGLGGLLPPLATAAVAILFLPVLGLFLAVPLLSAGKARNLIFLPLLALMTLAQGLVLAEMAGWGQLGRNGLYGATFLLLTMIAIIGGRIIPLFTENGLKSAGRPVTTASHPVLEKSAIALVMGAGLAWSIAPDSAPAGGLALAAGILNAIRLSGWKGWKTLGVPLLWSLHLGFAWLVAGLLMLGLSCVSPALPASAALHGLTAGCIGMMVLAVMSRAALGHSGRPLTAAPMTVLAYGLVTASAVLRCAGPITGLDWTLPVAGTLWSLGFACYLLVYAPICLKPRADGRPG